MNSTSTQIYGGRLVDLLNPKIEDVSIEHIATTLSRQPRFNGNSRSTITVAEHSIYVSDYLQQFGLGFKGLLHDAHEAFFGDVSTPLKRAIKELTGVDPMADISAKWDGVIFPAFGLTVPDAKEKRLIKDADNAAFQHEVNNLMWECDDWGHYPTKRYKPMNEKKAYEKFMERYNTLLEEHEWI